MSNVSIYEKNWIDLVFEDRNKTYGAYKLRKENPKITLFAFFGGILFLFSLIGLWLLISSFGEHPIIVPTKDGTVITITDFHYQKPDKPVVPKTKASQSQSVVKPTNFSHMVVTATPLAMDVSKNDNLPTNQSTTSSIGTDTPKTGNDGSATTITAPVIFTDVVSTSELDRLPEYPGGIKKFYEYVGNNFEKPNLDEGLGAVSVIMSFVIEKDGVMSNIKVLRSSDKKLEVEAIRVLKSLKVKWSPGYKDGDKMRTLYTLPIKVAL
ncbi:energy transducer TonB [Flavobacterium sp.]|uniref:energy transducer TonB n=1 Tax=Flavobacterium sp. TaxID=239 RepID=UPI0025DBD568|nr:energy transducer TonB [Flavobacterium sp.]